MTKKQFLKNKINELQKLIWETELEIKRGELLIGDLKEKLKEFDKTPIITKPNENPLSAVDEKKKTIEKTNKELSEMEIMVELLRHRLKVDEEFLSVLKKELKRER